MQPSCQALIWCWSFLSPSPPGSAEAFARGGVRLLHDTGIVTDLCFGSECGDLSSLERLAAFLAEEPTDYKLHLQDGLKQGLSFPAAREQAVRFSDPSLPAELLGMPNNLWDWNI